MANTDNLDLKRLDGPKTTKFDYDLYVENNFEKVDVAVGAPPSTLTTEAKTLVPAIIELESEKVDKVEGKGLSTNDFDNTYKQKIDTDIPAQLAEIENVLLPLKANKSQENWIAPTLINGWVNYGTSLQETGYIKDEFGFVNIRGGVKSGIFTANTELFELPLGYRPYRTCSFVLPYLSNQFAIIAVQPTGKVTIASAPGNVMLQLNNIRFKAV